MNGSTLRHDGPQKCNLCRISGKTLSLAKNSRSSWLPFRYKTIKNFFCSSRKLQWRLLGVHSFTLPFFIRTSKRDAASSTSIPHRDMFSYNKVNIIGYQTQPVTVRQTPGGTSVTDLNLVVPYRFKAEGGEMLSGKSFHTVTLWGPMAEVAGKFLKAGSHVFISGRLQTDSWEDPTSKEKRSKTKIVGMDMIMLDPKDGQLPALDASSPLSATVNRADIIGNITREPEVRTTTSGQKVLTLGVATNERWKDKASGTDKERSEFHNVVCWGPLADAAAISLHKGQRVAVSGRVQTRSWETKEGNKRYTTEIIADTVSLLGVRNPAIESSIDPTGSAMPAQSSHSEEPMGVAAGIEVPEITYASEIKAEDLPF